MSKEERKACFKELLGYVVVLIMYAGVAIAGLAIVLNGDKHQAARVMLVLWLVFISAIPIVIKTHRCTKKLLGGKRK